MKKIILLDVDSCMYHGKNPDGSHSEYVAANRKSTQSWASSLTGKTAEDLEAYRKEHGPHVGHDQSLLDFINLHTGGTIGIPHLAEHRSGPTGYAPEAFLKRNDRLVSCLGKTKAAGYTLVIVSDNPVAERTIRQLGIDTSLIPREMIFDSVRTGKFKNSEVLQKILTELDGTPADAAMFGDSPRSDIAPAEAIGVKAFLCEGPDALIEALQTHTDIA